MEKTYVVEGMHCEHCSARVIKALGEIELKASVSLEKGEVTVSGDNVDDALVKETIEDLGFDVK